MLKYSILSTGSYLRPIRRRNVDIFIIYYRTRNQKDKLLFIDMEKKHVFQFICKNRKSKQMYYKVQIQPLPHPHRDKHVTF